LKAEFDLIVFGLTGKPNPITLDVAVKPVIVFGLTGKPNPITLDVAVKPDLCDAAISFIIQIFYVYNTIYNIINLYI
jgi:hypothetical protein